MEATKRFRNSLKWPVGQGAKTNAGAAGLLWQTPTPSCYLELIYALGNGMPIATLRNNSQVRRSYDQNDRSRGSRT